jgi:hypothetical protein
VDAHTDVGARPDWTVILAVALLACGWFLMNSLITNLGFVQVQFHFYNVLTLMRSPARITTGAYGDGASLDAWLFGTLCLLALLAALAPLISQRRIAWLGCIAPFALMALVGVILYHELSQDFIADNGHVGSTGSQLIRFANDLANRVGAAITRQITVGLGGYLSVGASAYLAYRGLLGYQKTL